MNMLLLEDQRAFDSLLKSKVLKPLSENEYILALPELINQNVLVSVVIDQSHFVSEEQQIKKSRKYNEELSIKELREKFDDFLKEYPSSDHFDGFRKSRDLKTDPGFKAFDRYKKLVYDHDISPDSIMNAMKYEVHWRKRESKLSGENKMTYMRGLQPWLNDPTSIKTNLEEMNKDDDYTEKDDGTFGIASQFDDI